MLVRKWEKEDMAAADPDNGQSNAGANLRVARWSPAYTFGRATGSPEGILARRLWGPRR